MVCITVIPKKQVLGTQDAVVQKVREAQPRLLPTKIARDGSIMEWVSQRSYIRFLRNLFPGLI